MICPRRHLRQQKSCGRRIGADKRAAFVTAFRPFLDRSALRAAAAVDQMAEDFRAFAANAGAVSADDLEILGWTSAQIALHASAARQAANSRAEG